MFGIKPFEECVKDPFHRWLFIRTAERTNSHRALKYMRGESMNFRSTNSEKGDPEFWLMAAEIDGIVSSHGYTIEVGFAMPSERYDFEILTQNEYEKLCENGGVALWARRLQRARC